MYLISRITEFLPRPSLYLIFVESGSLLDHWIWLESRGVKIASENRYAVENSRFIGVARSIDYWIRGRKFHDAEIVGLGLEETVK